VIDGAGAGHLSAVTLLMREIEAPVADSGAEASTGRLRSALDRHHDFVWRTVRYLGVPDAGADDAAQQVFCVFAARMAEVPPAAEVSFLLTTAMRVASDVRRKARRRPAAVDDAVDEIAAALPGPEELLDRQRARQALQEVLDAMPVDLRVVFVLFELEEKTLVEIAELLELKVGTATSRLRRAREAFQAIVRRRQATERRVFRGGLR
jgi:RNA polymerase sigma-70 factor (ECF subfamily)